MDLANAIAIIIARPLVYAMVDSDALALNLVVAVPLIRIGYRVRLGEAFDVSLQSFAIGAFDDAQAHLSALTANGGGNDGWAIIFVRAVTALFVCAATWGSSGLLCFSPYFPLILENFISLSHGIGQWRIRLQARYIRLKRLAHMLYSVMR